MSYDLFFYTPGDRQISKEEFQGYFANLPNISGEWSYHNPFTGVYFNFEAIPEGDKTRLKAKTGYLGARLAFSIDYNKPTFFASEAMPVIENLCRQLDLQVLDPQDHVIEGQQRPKMANADELVASWVKVNRMAVRVYRVTTGHDLYYSREKAHQWWAYQFHLPAIRQQLGTAITAPELLLLYDKSVKQVCSTATWQDAKPFLFPPCERVIIFRTPAPGEHGQQDAPSYGWVEADELRQKLAGYMDKIETGAGALDVLRPEKAGLVQPIFQTLPLNRGVEKFKKVASDECVDTG